MYSDLSPWNPRDRVIDKKVSKELGNSPFDGDILHYRKWRDNMRDHLLGSNQGYGRILHEIESGTTPLTMEYLAQKNNLRGMFIDMTWITKTLWAFVTSQANNTTRKSIRTLVGGEELNGAELWRMMWIQNECGDEHVEAADFGALHRFPDCTDITVLQQYLGLWVSMAKEHGCDLPDRHLTTLLLNMLPNDAHDDVDKMNLLSAPYMTTANHIMTKSARWNYH